MTEASKSIGDDLIPNRSIPAEMRRRLAPHQIVTVPPRSVDEYLNNGWVIQTRLKRNVRLRRPKPPSSAFVDRVWAMLAKLKFTQLSRESNFSIAYGPDAAEQKQISIFAADDEVVLLIDCKSGSENEQDDLRTEIESISLTRPGVVRRIKAEYPNHKIKFIVATENLSVSHISEKQFNESDILHVDEEGVQYYIDLADHLGRAARYQLLGALFAGQKIPGIESTIPAIRGSIGGNTYYAFAIQPERILKSAYILHRNRANSALMPTYQRLIKRTRLQKIAQFVDGGGYFPNSLILNIDSGRRPLQFDRTSASDGSSNLGILHLPQTYRAAYVIDGQHRLYGYAESSRASSDLIPVVAFENMPHADQVKLFMQINENQQAVPKNLRNTLNADLLWASGDFREQARAIKLRVAQHLGESRSSALYGRVLIGENRRTALRCITIDAISSGIERGHLLGSFNKNSVKQLGAFYYPGRNDDTFDRLVEYFELCLGHVRDGLRSQWALGSSDGGFVVINNGVDSLLRIFSDVLIHVVVSEVLDPKTSSVDDLFAHGRPYIDSLIEHLHSLDIDAGSEYRRLYGSGGVTRYWRRLQMAIQSDRPEFHPEGLAEFLQNEERAFNTESFEMIRDIELHLSNRIRVLLENEHGSIWFKRGVPPRVQEAAVILALNKNRDRDAGEEVEPWSCLHLIDYYDILTQNHALWVRRFEKEFTRPGFEHEPGGWKSRAHWIQELNRIRNENDHTYSVKESEYEFLVALTTWLIKGQAENDL